jgi:hypothetical protein
MLIYKAFLAFWDSGPQKSQQRDFPFGLGMMLPFSPSSIPALANAFTTAAMVPLCPHGGLHSFAILTHGRLPLSAIRQSASRFRSACRG